MEDPMKAFIIKTNERLETHGTTIREHGTTIQNLERQVGQLANLLSVMVPKTLPTDTERNPKETIFVVSLRNGHELEDPIEKQNDELIEGHVEIVEEQKNDNIQKGVGMVDDGLTKKGKTRAQKKKKKDENATNVETEESKYMPTLPLPQKQRREKLDKQLGRFLEVLKQVHLNIPFIEVLSQMPAYAKFLKEILSKKQKVEETSDIKLTEHCSAILQNKLPQKCGDLGSFTIPCSLGSTKFEKSLCDSGASINLMPLSIFRKFVGEIGEIKSIPVSSQLADQTTIIPEGIVEDVLVKVDKFVFPVDFIVVNMEENREIPLILGRPFLATGRVILDIQERQLMLRVWLIFKMEGAKGDPKGATWRV
ncbi:uncharacterized protein [Nicotiana tomentosiformis]|uniref:uncharacterized protein n=1 Tax=Nicotiana tomentosiformis TaxID=4098 RepID=UPI00388CC9C6